MTIHHPMYTSGLVVAGMLPFIMSFPQMLTTAYYLCLMPSVIFQAYKIFHRHFIPAVRKFFKSD